VRLISFSLTTDQIRNRTKTVTRRLGWARLKPGTLLQPIVKGQGIPKGGKVETIGGPIRVVRVDREPLLHGRHPHRIRIRRRGHPVSAAISGPELLRRKAAKLCLRCGLAHASKDLCVGCARVVAREQAAKRKAGR
jgi:hypothetical protein